MTSPWQPREDSHNDSHCSWVRVGHLAVLWELCFLTESLFSYRYPLCECGRLSGNTWFVLCYDLHAQRLGFQTSSSSSSSSAPLCSSLSVSIVVTARCYVRSFCPPLTCHPHEQVVCRPLVHHCHPPSLENCHLETSCRESFLSPINLCFRVYSWVFPGTLCMTFVLCIDRVLFIFWKGNLFLIKEWW